MSAASRKFLGIGYFVVAWTSIPCCCAPCVSFSARAFARGLLVLITRASVLIGFIGQGLVCRIVSSLTTHAFARVSQAFLRPRRYSVLPSPPRRGDSMEPIMCALGSSVWQKS